MGVYSEYLNKQMNFADIIKERKLLLKKISSLRGNRDILVYASDLIKNAPISIDYTDILAFYDQLEYLNGTSLDLILETPGGLAEVVEDLVRIIRTKYKDLAIIIPGYAKSAGTIFAMAADEILMGPTSSLGPIDAQIINNNKRFSADAFLQGLEKIKAEVDQSKKLNAAYIPILQNISPGEIQHCENAQDFSKKLVTRWLSQYKFKSWNTHNSDGSPVTEEEKTKRAEEVAEKLRNHSEWLTHSRSIKISDLEEMHLKITDYSKDIDLNDAIMRYYTLLRMSFDANIYKLFETIDSQIYKFTGIISDKNTQKLNLGSAVINFRCPKCQKDYNLQANLKENIPIDKNNLPFPKNDIFKCPNCDNESNLKQIKLQIEAGSGIKII
ncbi:MAG: SDH family Clp fold serine proteinase [Candidatus Humimicrobiaceae bacterium]